MRIIDYLIALLFGIVEGITEWLPISSTGHMILLNEILKMDVSEEFWEVFLVVIQLGAILAVMVIYFDRLYDLMSEEERRKLMEALIQEIQIYPERQPNGQWLKSITFRLPIIDGEMKIPVNDGLDKNAHVETIVLLQKLNS